jgi:hypothetical protein
MENPSRDGTKIDPTTPTVFFFSGNFYSLRLILPNALNSLLINEASAESVAMCGIVGLFLKDPKLEPELGGLLSDMLVTMSDRGPDSAGIAIYGKPTGGQIKVTVQSPAPARDLPLLAKDLAEGYACGHRRQDRCRDDPRVSRIAPSSRARHECR